MFLKKILKHIMGILLHHSGPKLIFHILAHCVHVTCRKIKKSGILFPKKYKNIFLMFLSISYVNYSQKKVVLSWGLLSMYWIKIWMYHTENNRIRSTRWVWVIYDRAKIWNRDFFERRDSLLSANWMRNTELSRVKKINVMLHFAVTI